MAKIKIVAKKSSTKKASTRKTPVKPSGGDGGLLSGKIVAVVKKENQK